MRKLALLGQRFGYLVVTGVAPVVQGATQWHCQCDCGRMCVKTGKDLVKKTAPRWVHSCGCRTELANTIRKPFRGRFPNLHH